MLPKKEICTYARHTRHPDNLRGSLAVLVALSLSVASATPLPYDVFTDLCDLERFAEFLPTSKAVLKVRTLMLDFFSSVGEPAAFEFVTSSLSYFSKLLLLAMLSIDLVVLYRRFNRIDLWFALIPAANGRG